MKQNSVALRSLIFLLFTSITYKRKEVVQSAITLGLAKCGLSPQLQTQRCVRKTIHTVKNSHAHLFIGISISWKNYQHKAESNALNLF